MQMQHSLQEKRLEPGRKRDVEICSDIQNELVSDRPAAICSQTMVSVPLNGTWAPSIVIGSSFNLH